MADDEWDLGELRGVEYRLKRMNINTKDHVNSPRSSVRKKKAEIRASQRNAKIENRAPTIMLNDDSHSFVIGNQSRKRSEVLTIPSQRRLYCLSASCISDKDIFESNEDLKNFKGNKGKRKKRQRPKFLKPSRSELNRSRYIQRLKQVVTVGSSGEDRVETERKADATQQRYKLRRGELIWLELQSWFNDHSLVDQDQILFNARQSLVMDVLSFVSVFRYEPKYVSHISELKSRIDDTMQQLPDGACHNCGVEEISQSDSINGRMRNENEMVETLSSKPKQMDRKADVDNSPAKKYSYVSFPSNEYLISQENALKSVDNLLKLLCVTENLYPSSNILAAEYPYYNSLEFQSKVQALCSWFNQTTDLRGKFMSFVRILLINNNFTGNYDSTDADVDTDSDTTQSDFYSEVCKIGIDQLLANFTNRTLKQKSVKCLLQLFLQRNLLGLVRSKMAMMPQTSYQQVLSRNKRNDVPAIKIKESAGVGVMRDAEYGDETLPIHSFRLPYATKQEQNHSAHNLIEKIETSLKTSFKAIKLQEIINDTLGISCSDQTDGIFGLPSLKPLYLFLATAIFEIMRHCMHLRMKDAMPFFCNGGSSLSLLTAKQLVLESKEMLECGLLTKDTMLFLMSDFSEEEDGEHSLSLAFSVYEEDLCSMINTYLDFLKAWLLRMQRDLPHVPRSFQEILDQEWSFTCSLLPQIDFDSVILCLRRFLEISSDIACITREFLTTAVRELVRPETEMSVVGEQSLGNDLVDESVPQQQKLSPATVKAGFLWYQRQRSESPHLLRHSYSTQSADSNLPESPPVEYGRQTSSASSSPLSTPGVPTSSSMPWLTYRSTSYLGYQKRYVFEVCRAVRDLFNETRERATKILHFSKRLRKTLEPAIGYEFIDNTPNGLEDGMCSHCQLFDSLYQEDYVLVDISQCCQLGALSGQTKSSLVDLESYRIFMPNPATLIGKYDSEENVEGDDKLSKKVWSLIESILLRHIRHASSYDSSDEKNDQRCIIFVRKSTQHAEARRQSDVSFRTEQKRKPRGRRPDNTRPTKGWRKTKSESNFHVQEEGGVTHMRRCIQGDECSVWSGQVVDAVLDPDQCSDSINLLSQNLDLSHDITVVLESAEDVGFARKEMSGILQSAKLAVAQMAIVKGVKEVFDLLRSKILLLCSSLIECIDLILNYLEVHSDKILQHKMTKNESTDVDSIRQVKSEINEVMQSCFNFGFDLVKESTRIMSADFHASISKIHVALVTQWMNYVLKHRSLGKGYRPRWANQGLSFLVSMDYGCILKLSEDEFQNMKSTVDSFLSHLIGSASKDSTSKKDTDDRTKECESLHPTGREAQVLRSLSNSSVSDSGQKCPLPYEDVAVCEMDDDSNYDDLMTPIERIRNGVQRLEMLYDQRRFDSGFIGRVSDAQRGPRNINLGVRTVSFKWQRGARVGEGAFGRVYTCVNVDTGNILAMKEVSFNPNDLQKIRSAIDEYTNFEGIQHQNLVRYYGVELHRDEMYIFMEYCDGGTLADICKISLPEEMVRRYTSQILSAVHTLHSRGIVHRDIKGSNIFLTSSGILKLGDFGSAIKLRDVMKTTPGEMVTHIGTTLPYTAPEVINALEKVGYGRASDIWSLGCVVIEMATGKPPWHDFESFQIMFKVGNGERPPIPESLSDESKTFILLCTVPHPAHRHTAERLLGHPFVKVPVLDTL